MVVVLGVAPLDSVPFLWPPYSIVVLFVDFLEMLLFVKLSNFLEVSGVLPLLLSLPGALSLGLALLFEGSLGFLLGMNLTGSSLRFTPD